jgi:DNA-binding MarR family transcriptional regulator
LQSNGKSLAGIAPHDHTVRHDQRAHRQRHDALHAQLVDDLEALDVLARVPDPEDARAKRVLFIERGRAGLLEGLAVLRALEDELHTRVGVKAMAALRSALLAIHEELTTSS